MDIIRDFREATEDYEANLNRRRENGADVNRIIATARPIEAFLQANPQNQRIDDDWSGIKRQIARLGSSYGITPNWTGPNDEDLNVADQRWPVPKGGKMQNIGLSGTYGLDRVRSEQVVHVARESQKPIVLGKGGQRIKSVGAAARAELERMLERRVHLFLFVRVSPDWTDDPERYRALGLDFER